MRAWPGLRFSLDISGWDEFSHSTTASAIFSFKPLFNSSQVSCGETLTLNKTYYTVEPRYSEPLKCGYLRHKCFAWAILYIKMDILNVKGLYGQLVLRQSISASRQCPYLKLGH